ncbi:MAG: porin [Gammaproteobacteria bacterium]|nr:porin [Gammaproteobacteria bacterium]
MNNKRKKSLLARAVATGLLAATAVPVAAAANMQQRVEMLEHELATLKSELQKKEEVQQAKGVELKKGTRFQFGGYIKADVMWNDYSDGTRSAATVGDDFLVPSVIPTGDGRGSYDTVMDSHVKHSRMWFKTNTATSAGDVMSYVEVDFNSGGTDERLTNQAPSGLRHAFLKWSYAADASLLAGQTWSTFFNVGALPETVDFIGPTSGTLFIRQAQVRWTKGLGNGGSLMLAAENPSTSLYAGGGIVGMSNGQPIYATDNDYDDSAVPDLIARYDGKAGNLSYSVAGVMRELSYAEGSLEDDETGLALSVAGTYAFDNGDDLKFMLSHGNLGRYIALNAFRDGAITADGDIALGDVTGGFIAYRHHWNEKLRSTISYAASTADNPIAAGQGVNETVSNTNINLIYSPTKSLSFGAEYFVADRELESGVDGDLKRLQIMGKWAF